MAWKERILARRTHQIPWNGFEPERMITLKQILPALSRRILFEVQNMGVILDPFCLKYGSTILTGL